MHDLKNIAEFQKCGEIMVAAKRKEFAMSCNFCQQIFVQLPTFMRHLQLQHNNNLKFVKQAIEIEVYTVEELMNQTLTTCVPDVESTESDDAKWLSEEAGRMPEETVKQNKKQRGKEQNTVKSADEEYDYRMSNMSILKALEDCDVSFSLIDNLNGTKCSEDKKVNRLYYSLLQDIENDWNDSDSNNSISNGIDYNDTNILNFSEYLAEIRKELESDIALNEDSVAGVEKELNTSKERSENSPTSCIKSLLNGHTLDDLDDVDSLLETLESNVSDIEKMCKTGVSTCDYLSNNENEVVEKINVDVNSDCFDDFETCLKELNDDLDGYRTNVSNIKIKNANCKQVPKTSLAECYKQNDLDKKLNNLEEPLTDYSQSRLTNNIETSHTKFEPQLENSKDILNESENKGTFFSNILKKKNCDNVIPLNEDLTKALADALDDEDFGLLGMLPEEESEEILSQDILNSLEKQLTDEENDQKLPLLKGFQNLNGDIKLTGNKVIKTFKTQQSINVTDKSIVTLKYQNTNSKAKAKILAKNSIILLNSAKSFALKESNSIDFTTTKNSRKSLKGNDDISLHQQISINNSPNMAVENTENILYDKMVNKYIQRKTLPKENQDINNSTLNIRDIKMGKRMGRDEPPLNLEKQILKESPKSVEKQESTIKDITITLAGKLTQEGKIKQSPKTQEKQENLNPKYTPPTALQKTQYFKRKEDLKESRLEKSDEHNDKTQQPSKMYDTLISKKQKSSAKCLPGTNKKSPTQIQTAKNANYNDTTTPKKLKNVSIKLQRITPDKLIQKEEEKFSETNLHMKVNKYIEHFKLSKEISLTRIPSQTSSPDANTSEIIETPIKAKTFCKQNFLESSLEIIQNNETQKLSPIEEKSSLRHAQSQIINLKTEANLRQRKVSIDIVPSAHGNTKQQKQRSANGIPRNSILDYASYAINRSARKKEVLERMHRIKKQIIKSIENDECMNKVNNIKHAPIKQQRKQKVFTENIQVLPNLEYKALSTLNFNNLEPVEKKSLKNLADNQKKDKISLVNDQNHSSIKDDEKLIKNSLKRPATSPLSNENKQAKLQPKTTARNQNKVVAKTPDLEAMRLDPSESVINSLQRDVRDYRLNVGSLLNEGLAENDSTPDETSAEANPNDTEADETTRIASSTNTLINDLLEQVDKEQTSKEEMRKKNAADKDETLNNPGTVEDFDDFRDNNLLDKFGLKVIKCPDIEDTVSLEERDEMNQKAIKFANIYKNWPRIWSTKNSESLTMKQDLVKNFQQLLTDANQSFNLDLSIVEIKRLANLINMWYTHNFSSKFFKKRKISEATNRCLLMFHYITKTTKRFNYCEYCDDYFSTAHKYYTHRILHTGALFPYTCQKCSLGFKIVKLLRNHESSCNFSLNSKICKLPPSKSHGKVTAPNNKCPVCANIFATYDLLYEHSKTHLKSVYNCAKCKLVFASAADVQNHRAVNHTVTRRIPKPSTPRPSKPKAESYSRN